MLFTKAKFTSLVGFAVLCLAVSGQDNAKQHSAADSELTSATLVAQDAHMAPLNLANTKASKDAVRKLVGIDVSSDAPKETDEQAHCSLGHTSANIVRIRYDMSVIVDTDEGGSTTIGKAEKVQGAVVKATSGLYSHSSPDKGSCAKALARLGENCAKRPYVVPATLLKPATEKAPDRKNDAWYSAGPYKQKRDHSDDARRPIAYRADNGREPDKPDATDSQSTVQGAGKAVGVCVDTVKRNAATIKVVPTKARKMGDKSGAKLHFELVQTDAKHGFWSQIIYNDRGRVIDTTNLTLTQNMSFWRAEYYCANCPPGHKLHKIFYENVEIEMEKTETSTIPAVQCSGRAVSTNVHKRERSRYQGKSKSNVEYTGAIFSIDRVSLGHFDKNGKDSPNGIIKDTAASLDGSASTDNKEPKDYSTLDVKHDRKQPLPNKALLVNTAKPEEDKSGSAASPSDKTLLVNTANPDQYKNGEDASGETAKSNRDKNKPVPYIASD